MLKRPSAQDTEEDILKLQEEFLASKASPAVSVIKKPEKRKSGESSAGENKDVVSLKDELKPGVDSRPPEKKVCFTSASEDTEETLEKHDKHITKILSDIVERDFKNPPVYYPEPLITGGFPKVLHRGSQNETDSDTKPKKKKSIFAQQLEKNGAQKFGVKFSERKSTPVADVVREKQPSSTAMDIESSLISGAGLNKGNPAGELKSIHEENVGRLAAMSQDEVLKEQAELMKILDPGMVAFLKQRGQKKNVSEEPNKSTTTLPQTEEMESEVTDVGKDHDNVKKLTEETPKTSDLPLQPDRTWVNMNKIEYDKLEWTKSLPPPKAGDKTTGSQVRFDFKGHLVDTDADIPLHAGLHHHGTDPEQAGYSLEEIYQLSRSTNMQQRAMALNMLANIIRNARAGEFLEKTSACVIPVLLNGGLLFIMRWALDDSTEGTMVAAVNLLHALLVCKADEQGMDGTFHWFGGDIVVRLRSQDDIQTEGEEREQETDADVVKKDVVQGLLRMSVLERLRFILTKWRPAPRVVLQILEVLIRLARHSTQSAYQIVQCAGLLECLFKDFLPSHWLAVSPDSAPLASVYGYPIPMALKLVRVLCTAGRHITSNLIHHHPLIACLARYICEDPASLQLHRDEGEALFVEALRTWQVCARYGLAVDSLYDQLYPILMRKLQSQYMRDDLNNPKSYALITLLESLLHVAASVTQERIKQIQLQNKAVSSEESNTTMSLPDLDWSKVTGLCQPIKSLLESALDNFTKRYCEDKFDLTYISCLLNFVSSYISQSEYQPDYSAVDTVTELARVSETLILPCIKSQAFSVTLSNVRSHSILLLETGPARDEIPSNLPELGSLCGSKAEPCPVLTDHSTVQFCTAFTRFLLTLGKINKDLIQKLFSPVLQHEEVLQYIRKLCLWQKKAPHAANYFAKFENQLQYNLVMMAQKAASFQIDIKLYHQMSLYLFIHLHDGDEYLAHSLLSTAMFNPSLLSDISYTEEEEVARIGLDEGLRLAEERYLQSATSREVRKRRVDLVQDSCGHLQSVRNTYLQASAGFVRQLQQSRSRTIPQPLHTDRLQAGDVGQLLVPVDWPFLPLVELYNSSQTRESQLSGGQSDQATNTRVEAVALNALRWLFMLEGWRPGILESISLTLKLSRILCVFLAGNDLFLNDSIHGYLLSLLKIYCKPVNLSRLNLEEKIHGLTSFYDFYITLLVQFEAVSFGDPLFAGYILLAQQQCHAVRYRTAVWGEHCDVLRAISLKINQVMVPIQRFLEPEEENRELLRLYIQALLSNTVTPARTPLPYLIAVHHVNRFIYTQDGKYKKLKEAYLRQIGQVKNEVLKRDLLWYKAYDVDACWLGLYDTLPAVRHHLLETLGISF